MGTPPPRTQDRQGDPLPPPCTGTDRQTDTPPTHPAPGHRWAERPLGLIQGTGADRPPPPQPQTHRDRRLDTATRGYVRSSQSGGGRCSRPRTRRGSTRWVPAQSSAHCTGGRRWSWSLEGGTDGRDGGHSLRPPVLAASHPPQAGTHVSGSPQGRGPSSVLRSFHGRGCLVERSPQPQTESEPRPFLAPAIPGPMPGVELRCLGSPLPTPCPIPHPAPGVEPRCLASSIPLPQPLALFSPLLIGRKRTEES